MLLPILSCSDHQDQRSDDVEYVLWFSLLRVEIFVIRRSHFSFVKNEACNLSYVLSMFFFLRSSEFSTVLSSGCCTHAPHASRFFLQKAVLMPLIDHDVSKN